MSLSLLGYLVLPSDNKNVESLYLCGLPAFVLSNGSSLALFVGGVMYKHGINSEQIYMVTQRIFRML